MLSWCGEKNSSKVYRRWVMSALRSALRGTVGLSTVFLAMAPPLKAQAVSQQESDALMAIYNATGGPNWAYNYGWGDIGNECRWNRVICRDGKVVNLGLDGLGLVGRIPAEISQLPHLEILYFDHNFNLIGDIPREIATLTNLVRLDLSANQMIGGIPREFGELRNLRYLGLSENPLGGPIPPELGNLTNLHYLRLDHNQLSGVIPNELLNLTQLEQGNGLTLCGNELYSLNPALTDFLNTKHSADGLWQDCQQNLAWVALGDSYSSGEGAGQFGSTDDPTANYCHRSANVWSGNMPGGQIRDVVLPGTVRANLACSGALVPNFRSTQRFKKGGSVPPQLSHQELQGADLVTFTIGGNDLGFATILIDCIFGLEDCSSPEFVPVGWDTSLLTWVQENQQRLDLPASAQGSLRWAIGEVLTTVSREKVVVLSYPHIFDEFPAEACLGITRREALFWNQVTDDLNSILCNAANDMGVHFVTGVPTEFTDRGTCQVEPYGDPSWINGVVFHDWKQSFHPNRAGQAAYARALRAFLPAGNRLPGRTRPADCTALFPRTRVSRGGSSVPAAGTVGELDVSNAVPNCSAGSTGLAPSQQVTVSGGGFSSNNGVSLYLVGSGGFSAELPVGIADGNGSYSAYVGIPANAPSDGLSTLKAVGLNPSGARHTLYSVAKMFSSDAADGDLDGVPDVCDVCPALGDAEQGDSDGDGSGDACDACPNDSEDDVDGDSLCADVDPCPLDPDNDVDGDGACADVDSCPDYANLSLDDAIYCRFADGFESGDTTAWSSATVP